jgi:hypothetical protein
MALPGKSCMVVELGLFLETDLEGVRFKRPPPHRVWI